MDGVSVVTAFGFLVNKSKRPMRNDLCFVILLASFAWSYERRLTASSTGQTLEGTYFLRRYSEWPLPR